MRMYQNSSHPYDDSQSTASARRIANDDEPTLYLIAFKDHSIIQALCYWMVGGALQSVSVERTLTQVSLDLIDRDRAHIARSGALPSAHCSGVFFQAEDGIRDA